uniref:Uncharacterized protein n=1 Tax=Salix viminalis TaxID=40686 RepID=A0A6N2MR32_SALVM
MFFCILKVVPEIKDRPSCSVCNLYFFPPDLLSGAAIYIYFFKIRREGGFFFCVCGCRNSSEGPCRSRYAIVKRDRRQGQLEVSFRVGTSKEVEGGLECSEAHASTRGRLVHCMDSSVRFVLTAILH